MSAQLDQLRTLIGALPPANRFYAPRLKAAGIDGQIASLAEFSARMPFTQKNELLADQAAHPPYGSNLTFALHRYSRFCQTTGTSGQPLVWLDTAESWNWMLDNWARIYRAVGVVAGDRLYFAFSFGPFLGFWTAFEAATKLGFLCLPGGGQGSSGRLRAMIQHGATVLCCTPTYALRLAEVAAAEAIDLGEAVVRKIIVAGEPGGSVPDVRARITAAWHGAQVIDHYGMTEVGPTAFEERAGVLRILGESYFAEIVDPQSGAPMPAGAAGELVLTTLGRVASPVLRYRTGDLVKRLPEAEGFAIEGGVISRVDDMIVVRGVNIYPSAVDAVVRSIAGLVEYRVEVSRRGELAEVSLQVECDDIALALEIERALMSAFSLRIPVTRVTSGALPRFEMKARRWVTRD
jgi:phenylacetate-CoA ligase